MRPVLTELYRGLAEADWLTPARARKALTLLGLTTVAYLIALLALSWPRGIDPGGTPLGADFSCFYAASRLVLDGHAGWVWTREHLLPVERALFGDPYYYPYLYPPPYLFVCAPLALVPYFPALAAWLVGTTAVYLRMAKCWLGERGDWLLMLAFPALLVNLRNGQNGCLTAALFGLGAWFASRRPWLAGVFVGCLVIKPTLAVLFPLALPVILTAVRIVLVQNIGLAVIAGLIGGGGFGTFVFQGLNQTAMDLVLLGALPTIALALIAGIALDLLVEALDQPRTERTDA